MDDNAACVTDHPEEERPAECGPFSVLLESIDRLSFVARRRASDAPSVDAYAYVLRKRISEVADAVTVLEASCPSDKDSTRTQIRPRKARRPNVISAGLNSWRA